MRTPPTTDKGFTLVEVMVAVVIVALGLAAAFTAVNQIAHNAVLSRDRTLANWIAMNRLTELRLAEAWPDIGESDGEVEYAGQLWLWNTAVSETEVSSLRRVNVDIALNDRPDETIITLSGFLGPTGPPATLGSPWQAAPGTGDSNLENASQ